MGAGSSVDQGGTASLSPSHIQILDGRVFVPAPAHKHDIRGASVTMVKPASHSGDASIKQVSKQHELPESSLERVRTVRGLVVL